MTSNQAGGAPETTSERRVLVVDDDAYLRLLLSIEVPEVALLEASTMSEAYDLAVAEEPDAMLVDRRLADGDGLDFVRRVRKTFSLAQTPVIVITAGHDEADRLEVMRSGADEYLPKPIDPADLLVRLERVLAVPPEERRARRAALMGRVPGEGGDPDPVDADAAAAVVSRREGTPARRGLFRRRRR